MILRKQIDQTKKRWLILLGLLSLLALPGLVQAYAWQTQTIEGAGPFDGSAGINSSLALDGNDTPHISYWHDRGSIQLKYASWDGNIWQIEVIDTASLFAEKTSMAVDDLNRPHIAYTTGYDAQLRYVGWDGSSWQRHTIDEASMYTSLALDSNRFPHISYKENRALFGNLKYARWYDGSWHIEVVDPSHGVGNYNSLALDSHDHPHVSYYDETNSDLKYAGWDGSSWQIHLVDSEGDVGWETSLALDSNNYPHISYYDKTNNAIKYAYWNGSGWQRETIANGGVDPSLALDSNNYPHISYYDGMHLIYTRWNGSSWQSEIADHEAFQAGANSSLTLDSNGVPHISYMDVSRTALKYTSGYDDPTPPVVSANVSGVLGNNGWYISDVQVSWTVTDPETPFSTTNCETTVINGDTAGTTLTCTATSEGGTTSESVTIRRDTTPPTVSINISPEANAHGWHNSDVTVEFIGHDNTSGIDYCPPSQVFSHDGIVGKSGYCFDKAGNGTFAQSPMIYLDKTAPVVTVTGVTDGATYVTLENVPTAGCDTVDTGNYPGVSGVAVAASLTLTGGNPDGSGTFTAICDGALDFAGNSGSASATYTVLTVQQAAGSIKDEIQSLVDSGVLNPGQANGLIRPLDNAIRSLDKGQTADACNQFQDFIDEVNAKTPQPLDVDTATSLITKAEVIRAAIGCD
jgi:hypothetical protein